MRSSPRRAAPTSCGSPRANSAHCALRWAPDRWRGARVAIALVLARLGVVTARAAAALGSGGPPPVTVDPTGELVAWALGGLLALSLAAWLATAGDASHAARGARS